MPERATWTKLASDGFSSALTGAWEAAARHWVRAAALQKNDGEMSEPCSAFVQNNAGVGLLLLEANAEAHLAFRTAVDQWRACLARTEHEPIELQGRSSSHHLRLGAAHGDAFASALRRRWLSMAAAGLEIAEANVAFAEQAPRAVNVEILRAGLGEMSLAAATGGNLGEEARARLSRHVQQTARLALELLADEAPLSFWPALERGAELSLLMHPLLFSSTLLEPSTVGSLSHLRET